MAVLVGDEKIGDSTAFRRATREFHGMAANNRTTVESEGLPLAELGVKKPRLGFADFRLTERIVSSHRGVVALKVVLHTSS